MGCTEIESDGAAAPLLALGAGEGATLGLVAGTEMESCRADGIGVDGPLAEGPLKDALELSRILLGA